MTEGSKEIKIPSKKTFPGAYRQNSVKNLLIESIKSESFMPENTKPLRKCGVS
jgi:hypothetical protein